MTPTTEQSDYRVPAVWTDPDDVETSLDEFSTESIIDYLRHLRDADSTFTVSDSGLPLFIDPDDMGHIFTLSVCGQQEQVRALALEVMGEAIGRTL